MTDDLLPGLPNGPDRLSRAELERLLDAFYAGKKPRTVAIYRDCLLRIADFAGFKDVDAFTRAFLKGGPARANLLVIEFKDRLRKRKLSSNYANQHVSALRSLLKFYRSVGAVTWTLDVKLEKVEAVRDSRGPGLEGVARILEAAKAQEDPWAAARDEALLSLLFLAGLRRFEVVGLDLANLELDARPPGAWVLRKWRNEPKRITVAAEAARAIRAWLLLRGFAPGPLFTSRAVARRRAGNRLSEDAVRWIVRRLGVAAGLGPNVKPHGLRHAGVTDVLDATDGNVRLAQAWADHARVDTTIKYDDARRDLAGQAAELLGDRLRAERERVARERAEREKEREKEADNRG